MEETEQKTQSLREIRENEASKKDSFMRRHFSFLFHPGSTFYYAIALYVLGFFWMAFPLFTNSFTHLLNWDYTWQYIPFTYDYWDAWHLFFTTGHFPLYDPGVYMGTDMIGSGSYYGLFDPFMFICYIFPRSWIPQTYAQMTIIKIVTGGLFMRMYLKRMGIREWTARFGAVMYTVSGFTAFFMGAPNFASSIAIFPLILYGIERVIRDQKIVALSIGVFLLAISCFFFVPTVCIFGVIYALWRFFATIKDRNRSQQFQTMLLGVAGFAIGLLLSAFSFIPSMRETMLSGRSASIGTAYWHSIKQALKDFDFRMVFGFVFEEVGDHPGREMMGLISFFFPTGGWTNLPFERGGYDAWTSALFCYTPGVILFFAAMIHSVRLKKWHHFLVISLCIFAVFTNFSYFFFFAFSGNGYGRWYMILIPLIVYYCCWGFDQRKEGPAFIPFAAAVLGLVCTIVTYYMVEGLLANVTFGTYGNNPYNTHNTTYWVYSYYTGSKTYNGITSAWYFYYQIALLVVEGVLYCIGQKKKWMPYVFFGFVCAEAIVMGNASFAFNGTWSYEKSFLSGENNRETSLVIANTINSNDSSFFRTHADNCYGSEYAHNVYGLNVPATFHSLMNFDVENFAIINHMKLPGSYAKTYNDETYYNPRWSGFYGNKRYSIDSLLGYRYYVVMNDYSGWKDNEGNPLFLPANVPFDSVEMTNYSPNRNRYRIYKRSEESLPHLGYAVDSDLLYRIGEIKDTFYENAFFNNYYAYRAVTERGSFNRLQWAQYVELNGAIIDDNVTLPSSFGEPKQSPVIGTNASLAKYTGIQTLSVGNGIYADYYLTDSGNGLLPDSKASYASEGVGYFLNHYKEYWHDLSGEIEVTRDLGKLAFVSQTDEYLNDDPNGCYIELNYCNDKSLGAPRIYAIGDTFDGNGNMTGENVCLSFDGYLLPNATHTDYYCTNSCTFGLYAKGRVKAVVACYGNKGSIKVNLGTVYMTITEKSDIDALEAERRTNALRNVVKGVNTYTFDTAYDTDRIVVTQLGYDLGWGVTATLPNGEKKVCQTLRLDGGLVGFVAPGVLDENGNPAKVTYVMEYKTPYSTLSVIGWVVGSLSLIGIVSTQFYFARKAKKKEQEALSLPQE